ALLRKIDGSSLRLSVADAVDPPVVAMRLVGVALTRVGPVGNKNAAVGAGAERDTHEPRILGNHQVPAVAGDITRAFGTKNVVINPPAMDVAHESRVAVARRKVIPEIDERAAVGMATPQSERFRRLPPHRVGQSAGEEQMVAAGRDAVVVELA